MKTNTLEDLKEIVFRIQNDNFSGVEIRSLLTILRWHTNSEIIKDLAHFTTHDDRDRGVIQKNIQELVNKFLNFILSGKFHHRINHIYIFHCKLWILHTIPNPCDCRQMNNQIYLFQIWQ